MGLFWVNPLISYQIVLYNIQLKGLLLDKSEIIEILNEWNYWNKKLSQTQVRPFYDNKISTFYRNVCNNKSFISIKLVGTKSNRDAIGAKTFLYEAGHLNEKEYCRGLREINGGYGYGCQNSIDVHYGVDLSKMYDLKVQFPSGIEIIKQNINPGQFLVIYEEQGFSKLTSSISLTISGISSLLSFGLGPI